MTTPEADAAPNIAIYYHPDGFDTKNRPLMGRRAAGKSFLEAWFARRGAGDVFCCANRQADFEHFVTQAKTAGVTGKAHWLRLDRLESVAQTGTLYFPGPDIGLNAWRRHRRDPRAFSIIGVTHTICTKAVMDGITEWLTAPVEPWDAVMCTSNAVRESVDYVLAAQREHLHRRNGATRFPTPQLPVIPLGINTADFAPDEKLRVETRAKLGIGADDIAVLFVGRLSIYGKAHPLPMFIALQRAAQASGRKLHLVLAGWFASAGIEKAFRDGAARLCPDVTVHFVDGRDDAARGGAWRAGDIFVSLVDNVQETFGLTPVEAMAAALPVVVSDWDGYRDTVRHGVDGFRVPTIQAPAALGEALADRYAADIDNYDMYLARTTYNVVVDVDAAASAFVTLINDADLRRRMGEAGRARALANYDWRHILGRYEALAAELGERRGAAPVNDPRQRRIWPARLSPFEMFANYPSRLPQTADRVRVTSPNMDRAIADILAEANPVIDSPEQLGMGMRQILAQLGAGEMSLADLLAGREPAARMQVIALLLRLAKFGVISIAPQDGQGQVRPGPDDPR